MRTQSLYIDNEFGQIVNGSLAEYTKLHVFYHHCYRTYGCMLRIRLAYCLYSSKDKFRLAWCCSVPCFHVSFMFSYLELVAV